MNAISKRLLSFVIVLAMVLAMTPVIPFTAAAATTTQMTAVETWHTAADGALKFAGQTGDVSATCPVCNTTVTWTPLTALDSVNGSTAGHYYIASDIDTNSRQYIRTTSSNAASERICLYLNDNSLEVNGHLQIRCQFNVITGPSTAAGDNTITRAEYDATSSYNTGLFYMANLYGTLSFYGGTYQNNYASIPLIKSVYQGKVNIYDGTFNSVSSVYSADADASSRANSTFTMYDGTLTAGTGSAVVLNNSGDDFIMNGGSITGEVKAANTGATITLSGAPTITAATGGNGLVLGGVLANVDGLLATANIQVTGALGDKLSAASDNAATAAQAFTVIGTDGLVVEANDDNQLEIVEYVAPFVPPAECPCCGVAGDQLEWTAISEPFSGKPWYVSSASAKKHVYLAKDITVPDTYAYVFMNAYNEGACLYLNGKTLTYNGTAATVFRTAALPLTIFGDGNVINNGPGYMFDFNGAGIVNIYGGTYTHNGTDATKLMFENNALSGVSTHAMIYGGTFNVNVGTYDEDNSYNYNNVQIADGYDVTNNGNGTWTVAAHTHNWGEGVETTPATCTSEGVMTYTCSGCGETKTETIEKLDHDFSGNGPTCDNCDEVNPDYEEPVIVPPSFDVCPGCGANGADITWTALSGTYGSQQSQTAGHYYLTGDYTQTGGGRLIYLSGDACLYLNGHDMSRTNTAPSYAFIDAGYYVLNIFGEGNVTDAAENDKNMFSYGGSGTIHIKGGNYTFNGSGSIFRDYTYTGSAASHVVLHGGTFNVNLNELTSGKTTFTITEGYEVKANDNGTWTVAESKTLCPGCGQEVLPSAWVEYTGQNSTADTAVTSGHVHYKLAADYKYTTGYGLYVNGGTVCFDLGESTISRSSGSGATFQVDAGTLNVFGENGTAVGGSNGCVRTGSAAAIVNLKSGTFQKHASYTAGYAIDMQAGGTVNLYGGTVTANIAGSNNGRGGICVHLRGTADNKAVFNMYGGEVILGDTGNNNMSGVNWGGAIATGRNMSSETSYAEVNITGGTVTGGTCASVVGDAIFIKNGTSLTIGGTAVINGEVYLQDETATLTLKGAPTITAGGSDNVGLVLNGALANIDQLAAGAQIAVSGVAGDTLTAASENAEAVKDCFILASDEIIIEVVDNQLMIVVALKLPTTCPGCGATLTAADWTELASVSGQYSAPAGAHIYLSADITSKTAGRGMWAETGDFCLYLNGHDFTHTGGSNTNYGRTIDAGQNTVTIWGEGTVSNTENIAVALFGYGGRGQINIYGGTYEHNGSCAVFENVAFAESVAGAGDQLDNHVNVYGGTFNADLSKVNTKSGSRYMVKAHNVSVVNGNSETVYADGAAAMAAYNGGYIRANQDAALEISGNTYIDAAGNVVTVTGSGNLYGMDSSGDDYTTGGKFLIADSVNIQRDVTGGANGYRYISLNSGTDVESGLKILKAHRLEMKLTSVSLRPGIEEKAGQMGLYYKATFSCGSELDTALQEEDNAFGIVLSLADMPGADFFTDKNDKGTANENLWTEIKTGLGVNAENNYTVVRNSGAVFGIMKADETLKADNATRGEMDIYANAYMYINFDGDEEYDADEFIVADNDTNTENDVAWSLYDVLAKIDQKWADFEAVHDSVTAFYSYWYTYGMDAWSFENITKV